MTIVFLKRGFTSILTRIELTLIGSFFQIPSEDIDNIQETIKTIEDKVKIKELETTVGRLTAELVLVKEKLTKSEKTVKELNAKLFPSPPIDEDEDFPDYDQQ
jgi:hypothetical protein